MPILVSRAALAVALFLAAGLAFAPDPALAIWMGEYLPAHGPSYWTYVNREDPFDIYTDAVFDTASFGGIDGVKFGEPGDYNIVYSTGRIITVPARLDEGTLIDFEPDVVLGWVEDGDPFLICHPADCDTNMIRDWQAIDPALRSLYGIDLWYEDLWVIFSYDSDYSPNLQNTVAASNLPVGVEPPPGAVTGIEWYQRGIGMVAVVDVMASSGGLSEFYDLVDWYVGVGDEVPGADFAALRPARPNPFNARTRLMLELQRAGPVRVDVVDLRGRAVRMLLETDLEAGVHAVTWDGRDAAGQRSPSGTYLVRLQAAGRSWVRPVSLVQ